MSLPNGNFTAIAPLVNKFPVWAQDPDAVLLAGMVNDDAFLDLVLVGPAHWSTVPVAFGTGAGTFAVTNKVNTVLPNLAGNYGTVTPPTSC